MSNIILVSFARPFLAAAFAFGTILAFASPAVAHPSPIGLGCEENDYLLEIVGDVLTCEGKVPTGAKVPLVKGTKCAKPLFVSGPDTCNYGTISCDAGYQLKVDYSGIVDQCVKYVNEYVPDFMPPVEM